MTNRERITSMTNLELSQGVSKLVDGCKNCPANYICKRNTALMGVIHGVCEQSFSTWLEQEEGVDYAGMAKFEKDYCEKSEISINYYNEEFVTLPCNCGQKDCNGWACVSNNKRSIENHTRLYAPKGEQL